MKTTSSIIILLFVFIVTLEEVAPKLTVGYFEVDFKLLTSYKEVAQ